MLASIEFGGYNYIRKPFKIEELQTTIIVATKDLFESRIKFKEIYEYDMTSKQLFKNGKEVQMPKMRQNSSFCS